MNIIIEEIVTNPLIQIEETIQEITIPVSEMQMPGKSAYQSALDGGFIGNELEFNESLADVLPHISNVENPHQVTKTQVGLGNVDNTSDVNKPISIAQQLALDNKVDKVVGERLINASEIVKLSNTSGTNTGDQDLSTYSKFIQVNTYALMLAIPIQSQLKIVKVLVDENKGIENTIYHIYPDGVRMWIASVLDN